VGSPRFLIKEIALQAGVSTATVDRVLNKRSHVRHQTRGRVLRAIDELERLQDSLDLSGERFLIDIVMEAPDRFAQVVRMAVEAEVSSFLPTLFRPRFHLRETWSTAELAARLKRIGHGGSKGVLLKARDQPQIRAAIQTLRQHNVPTATLVTDIPDSGRIGYAGLDNAQAGETASYLMARFVAARSGAIVVTASHDGFRGEEQRVSSFKRALAIERPDLTVTEISGGYGRYDATRTQVFELLRGGMEIIGVYSAGGGNTAILDAFRRMDASEPVIVGHDLDDENRELLAQRRISAVIIHDLHQDIRHAFSAFLRFHKPKLNLEPARFSSVQIITPANLPVGN
tara:strand:- start:506 stop:1534 length:1029 start_codon:yes stop_codon:yes gene_type:complete